MTSIAPIPKKRLSAERLIELILIIQREGKTDKAGAAFNEIQEAYSAALIAFISVRMFWAQDRVEDVVQEVWIILWDELTSNSAYDPAKGKLYTYMVRFIVPKVLEKWSRAARRDEKLNSVLRGARGSSSPNEQEESQEVTEIGSGSSEKPRKFPVFEGVPTDPSELLEMRYQSELVARCFLILMQLIYEKGGYPHEVLTFCVSKVIHGSASPRGLESNLDWVDQTYGEKALQVVAKEYSEELKSQSDLAETGFKELDQLIDPLRARLKRTLQDLAASRKPIDNHVLSNAPAELLEELTGISTLRAFNWANESSSAVKAYSHWCDAVRRRIRRVFHFSTESKEEVLEAIRDSF